MSETTRQTESSATCEPESAPGPGESVLGDAELLAKATEAENGEKFEALYTAEWPDETLQCRYDSRRQAELALVVHLLWWARHDEAQVRRLFERAALGCEDWSRYAGYYGELVAAARDLLGARCYDPDYHGGDDDA